jgi:diguanylate cyclase (GGDEF)-like protein
MGMSIFALFAANAVVLAVTALAFYAAWLGQRHERYWISWIIANLVLAVSMVFFILLPADRSSLSIVAANALMVLGLGFRWHAARRFGRRSASLVIVFAPALVTASLYAVPSIVDRWQCFTIVNGLMTILATATAYEFFRDRQDRLLSRYGLIGAYALLALGFAMRVAQGLLLNNDITNYLPEDMMLLVSVFGALFHTAASAAFALSIAFERNAIELREAALRDPLTGLYNRRAFEIRLKQYLADGAPFAVVILDIDHFKVVNDRYGHAAGDVALCACAEIILETLRAPDFVARIGGEEFAVILPRTSPASALEVIERVRSAIAVREIVSHGSRFRVTLSGGVAHRASGSEDMDALMKAADAGVYRAKKAGRNRIEQAAA